MAGSIIASYAILKVNWERGFGERKDYLDNFVLIVAEAIRQLPNDVIVLSELQMRLKISFGLDIPQNTIKSLLNRVKDYRYIKLDHGIYSRNNSEFKNLKFHEIQQQVLQAHESLIEGLVSFVKNVPYDLTWSTEQAEDAIQQYLEDNDIRLLSYMAFSDDANDNLGAENYARKNSKTLYYVAKYVEWLRTSQSAKLEYFETVVKGNLLANAIFMTDPSTYQRKFKNTDVFFDTPLVIFALGYAGEPRKWPVIELINLLKTQGAQLKIFSHTKEEIIGILSACANRIERKQFRDSYGPSIEYFIEKGYSEVDVMMFIANLVSDLASLGISVVDKPIYADHKDVIDETAYSTYLSTKIGYSKDRELPLERDKDSIAAIIRFRKGGVFIPIEECVAIFVTQNSRLAFSTREYSEFNYKLGTAPLALTDYELTNLVWLKNPTAATKLPFKRIIADSFAATQPSDVLWSKYLAEIDRLEKDKKISSDQYFILRYSIQAKSELMESTRGNDSAFSEGTIQEIYAIIESKIRAQDVERANAEELAKKDALKIADEAVAARIETEENIRIRDGVRKSKLRKRAVKITKNILMLATIFLILVFSYLTYAISPIGPLSIESNDGFPSIVSAVASSIILILLIIQTVSWVTDIGPKTLLENLEPKIARRVETFLDVELDDELFS